MKRIFQLAALALTLGFTACTQDDTPQGGVDEQEIRIATRSGDGDESGTATTEAFTEDFTLELWSTTDATKHDSYKMTYTDGKGWNIVKTNILPAHAFAYKGTSVESISYDAETGWNYTATLQADQSDFTKLANADVMVATGEAVVDAPLDLNFEHVFAKVTFNYEMGTEFTSSDTITACKVKGDTVVTACVVDDKTISAIVAPGTYNAGSEFVSITVGNNSPLTVNVPKDGLTFAKGKHYTFKLKVGKDKVTIEKVTNDGNFPGWDNDSEVDLN